VLKSLIWLRRENLNRLGAARRDGGLSAAEIRAGLMRARDLSKKGNLKRQREYTERTAGRAVRQAE